MYVCQCCVERRTIVPHFNNIHLTRVCFEWSIHNLRMYSTCGEFFISMLSHSHINNANEMFCVNLLYIFRTIEKFNFFLCCRWTTTTSKLYLNVYGLWIDGRNDFGYHRTTVYGAITFLRNFAQLLRLRVRKSPWALGITYCEVNYIHRWMYLISGWCD